MLFTIINNIYSVSYGIFLLPAMWYSIILMEWGLHKLGHINCKYNIIYHIHIEHHKLHYPVKNLLQNGPYKSGKGGYIYGAIIFCIWIALYLIVETKLVVTYIIFSALFIYISDHLHSQYHIKHSYLEKLVGDWFIKKREYHFQHHQRMDTHLSLSGICTHVDKILSPY